MDCPRCGATDVQTPECPRCGVIVAKARAPRATVTQPVPAEGTPAWRALVLPAFGLVALVVAAVITLRPRAGDRPSPEPPPHLAASGRSARDAGPREADRSVPADMVPALSAPAPSAPPDATRLAAGVGLADQATVNRLTERLASRVPLGPDDTRAAEDLYARRGPPARDLLEAVLVAAATQERGRRRPAEAVALLRRAVTLTPPSPAPRRLLLAVLLETGDWPGAEAAARELLALAPADAGGTRGLAYALVRQDRSREALDLLRPFVDAHPDAETRALYERIRRDTVAEAGLEDQRLSHFHVHYDGDAHEEVGRGILRELERHYATLVRAFDHEPAAPIPVVLLSTSSYYDSTGAPAWSGGQYDSFDGRVRLPIGGLTTALTPDLDQALLHELTHAFVADRSRGVAPREIQEGLAQWMEGRRSEERLGPAGLQALAEGRVGGVAGFYAASLSLVEDLLAQRGQGGINDLLQAMADTGKADEAFRRVYGKDFAGLKADWATRLRQRHAR